MEYATGKDSRTGLPVNGDEWSEKAGGTAVGWVALGLASKFSTKGEGKTGSGTTKNSSQEARPIKPKETSTMGSESLGTPVPNEVAYRGTTAYTAKDSSPPRNLAEQLAIEEAMSKPNSGTTLPTKLGDSRWHENEGWVKVEYSVRPNGEPPPAGSPAAAPPFNLDRTLQNPTAPSNPVVQPIGPSPNFPLGNPNGASPRSPAQPITVHFVKNKRNGQIDDFKIKTD
jgi:hypothetical protein